MLCTGERAQDPPSVHFVGRLADSLPIHPTHSVCCQNDAVIDPRRNGGRFEPGDMLDHRLRARVALLHRFVDIGRQHVEGVAVPFQQLAPCW